MGVRVGVALGTRVGVGDGGGVGVADGTAVARRQNGRNAARRIAANLQHDACRFLRLAGAGRDPQLAGPVQRDLRARLAADCGFRDRRQLQRLGRIAQVKLDRRAVGHGVPVVVDDHACLQVQLAAHLDARVISR